MFYFIMPILLKSKVKLRDALQLVKNSFEEEYENSNDFLSDAKIKQYVSSLKSQNKNKKNNWNK